MAVQSATMVLIWAHRRCRLRWQKRRERMAAKNPRVLLRFGVWLPIRAAPTRIRPPQAGLTETTSGYPDLVRATEVVRNRTRMIKSVLVFLAEFVIVSANPLFEHSPLQPFFNFYFSFLFWGESKIAKSKNVSFAFKKKSKTEKKTKLQITVLLSAPGKTAKNWGFCFSCSFALRKIKAKPMHFCKV